MREVELEISRCVDDENTVYLEEIPNNAIRQEGMTTSGYNLLLCRDFQELERNMYYDIILIPKKKY